MSTEIRAGGLLVKDPNSTEVYTVKWDVEHFADQPTVTIAASTFTITGPDTVLTKDNEFILAGNRQTQVRLLAGTLGAKYTVTNRITTNESPAQIKDASWKVLIQNR
jgi:hypothetical protein